jgi:hypothetical protein
MQGALCDTNIFEHADVRFVAGSAKQQDDGFGISPIRGLPVKPVASLP